MHGVAADQVLVGIGSSDILRLAASAYLKPGRTVVVADPTFEIITLHAERFGATIKRVPLTASHAHNLEAMREGDLVYVCNPNNPTGTITPKAQIRAYLERVPQSTIVVVDEAYHHYATSPDYESVIPLVAKVPNLIVTRTFSKIYALAGAGAATPSHRSRSSRRCSHNSSSTSRTSSLPLRRGRASARRRS